MGFYTNYLTDKYASTAPLNKSHKDFGFIEPIFHFNVEDIQSNGFSQIIPNYFSPEGDFFVTSLNGRTIYNLKAKDGPSELTKFINTGERIRDIIFS